MKKILLTLALVMALPQLALADWFTKGETLVYDVTLGGMHAGQAEMNYVVRPDCTYRLTIRAWSEGFVQSLFKMRDRLMADGKHGTDTPFYTTEYNTAMVESHHKARRQTVYNRKKNEVTYRNLRGHPVQDEVMPLVAGSRDIISAMYSLRQTVGSIEVGQVYSLPVFDVRKPYTMNVRVTGREKVKTPLGKFMAYVVKVQFVGEKETTDNVTVWMADDVNRWPVKIARKMAIGSFTATLKQVGEADLDVPAPEELPRTGEIVVPE